MSITSKKNTVKKLTKKDKGFNIQDGLIITPRADIEFSRAHCPEHIFDLVHEALENGWIRAVAYVDKDWHNKEMEWNALK